MLSHCKSKIRSKELIEWLFSFIFFASFYVANLPDHLYSDNANSTIREAINGNFSETRFE